MSWFLGEGLFRLELSPDLFGLFAVGDFFVTFLFVFVVEFAVDCAACLLRFLGLRLLCLIFIFFASCSVIMVDI